jgi:hypothetical protein
MNGRKLFSSTDSRRGYSLLEGVLALAVLAIAVGMASSFFLELAPKYRLKNAVWEINSRLNYARYKAIFDGIKVRIKFNERSYALEIYDESQKKWKREREYSLNGVTIQANNSPIFHPEGSVSNLASIHISNSWGAYKITIAFSGRIKAFKL